MAENNIKEFEKEVENKVEETTQDIQVQKKGFITKWNQLAWWQRALILTGAGTLVFVGGRWIFKSRKEAERKAVVDALEKACNDPVLELTNNVAATDAAVQNLVDALAETQDNVTVGTF